ncbi:MAG: YdeI/OmpD-associated family protein [Candidatus Micrarchaeota archaeon]|nr:YdeI/OmpD-associated family protein [Candidatus Micrarchaeota archaeon]
MPFVKFASSVRIRGVNPYVLVSSKLAQRLKPNWRRHMPVLVQVNGRPNPPWHINMVPNGNGGFYLYLHGAVRKASNTKVGEKVTISIKFDSRYRGGPQHPIPPTLLGSLQDNPKAQKNWEALTPSRKKEILRYLASLKSEEAKERNIRRALGVLSGSKKSFMGRLWDKGR